MIDSELQQVEKYYHLITEYLVTYSMQIFGAILILFFGLWVAQKVSKMIAGLMQRHNIDITLTNFVSNVVKVLLIIMFLVIALGKIGISVTPFVAAIGAASLGAGLALQGMLSNYGAGLAIIATRPFVVGDTIEVKGVSGQVKTIELGYTILINEEKVEITIPNKHIVGEILHNSFSYSLVKGEIDIAYDANADLAIELIETVLKEHELVADEPHSQVGIERFADSGVTLSYRYWVPTTKIIETKLSVNRKVFSAIQGADIDIPFPQRIVTLNHTHEKGAE
ncbi:mechanosensitive ion channel family protein [Pseudoalteromonas lipolytica]|jgi:small conductance mechanosensitive channel|uniref:Small-conductance mechanosensitive channel n=2 Tax=Pseudoalteromonas lipolytica TaxID=570156 RepID=A0AAD0WD45_9GAMM|nr:MULTISPECIES: mechanosensitive ion channel family protein [Pseudoalteromonas]AXV65980.1 mechanosensitive ion channel family protein [Pseudoalteromonas donghaensis]MAE01757.1 mechanosensitive ion channel family protein [Pseudoalteromonas sp.]MCC9659554.1 mechanosensitive ion channel family protein [Pseudoalteromonas sp. MB41]QLJ07500.1 mechanosensitive ion channel family protein [Pseudoalteromonas sp. JSTW]QMW13726.1 mechanosensitive ion channel family protein [Pseudoalteromonas sp. MT33b]|tara:strand:- start:15127 stop:15969 length:843 start_codon:yes stop_codon:yes gene_type:complete